MPRHAKAYADLAAEQDRLQAPWVQAMTSFATEALGQVYANGWVQVDTAQDASYLGTWAHRTRLLIFNYCGGDTTRKEAASPEEFAVELREMDAWNLAQGHGQARIDPGYDPAI